MVDAYKAWLELDKTGSGDAVKYIDTTYTDLGAKACATATCDVDKGAKNNADCKAECDKLPSWKVTGKIPDGTIDATKSYCYGYYHKDDNSACKLCYAKQPTAGAAAVGFKCWARKKSD